MPKSNTRRLFPPVSAGLLIEGAKLELERDERGQAWCFEFGIGGLRRKRFGLLPSSTPARTSIARSGKEAANLLAEMCEGCTLDCPLRPK